MVGQVPVTDESSGTVRFRSRTPNDSVQGAGDRPGDGIYHKTRANANLHHCPEAPATRLTKHAASASRRKARNALMRFLDCGAASRNMPPLSPGVP